MSRGIFITLFALCVSSTLCGFKSRTKRPGSSCVSQFVSRFQALEKKMDLLLKFHEKNTKADMSCGDAGVSIVTPDPKLDLTTTKALPTAYPDNVGLPVVKSQPLAQKMIVTQGYEVRLPCSVNNVNDQVDWFLGPVRIATGYYAYSLDLRIGVQRPWPYLWYLNIASVIPEDQGMYSCVVNENWKASRILLIVVEPEYTTITADEGSSLSVPCSSYLISRTNESSVAWSGPAINTNSQAKAHTKSANRVRVNDVTGDLMFKSVTRSDAGNYTCSMEGRFLPRAIYHVAVKTVAEPPLLIIDEDTVYITAASGRSVTLSCVAKGTPCPSVTWIHNYDDVTETSSCIGNTNNASLTLNNMTSVSQLVTCVATNDYGTAERQISLTGDTPALVRPPRDVVTSQTTTVAIFHCLAHDDRAPDIHWVKRLPGDSEDKIIPPSSRRYNVIYPSDGESVLVVDPVRNRMNGTRFTCVVARPSLGSANASRKAIEASASLKLYRKPNADDLPTVNIHIGTRYLDSGVVVEVRCTADGSKDSCPRLRWYRDNVPFVHDYTDPRITVSDGPCESMMKVTRPRPGDIVRYRCSAENSHGITYSGERVPIHIYK